MLIKNQIRLIFLILVTTVLLACYRGEAKSIDTVYETAFNKFNSKSLTGLKPEVKEIVDKTLNSMESLAKASRGNRKADSYEMIADALLDLTPFANYTVRPALTELSKQYRALAGHINQKPEKNLHIITDPIVAIQNNEKATKLLLARTYFLINSELESTKFGLG